MNQFIKVSFFFFFFDDKMSIFEDYGAFDSDAASGYK